MHIILILLFMLGGCGWGNAKRSLSPEEITHLKNEPKVYFLDYKTPAFIWWIHHSDVIFAGSGPYTLAEVANEFNVSAPLLTDPTVTLKKNLGRIFNDNYELRNIVDTKFPDDDDTLRTLKARLGTGKVIDLKTNFWQLWGAPVRPFVNKPEKASYQFQYSGRIRLIDLDSETVLHQHHCHFPWRDTRISIHPHVEPNPWSAGVWEFATRFSVLVANQGEQLQKLIDMAINHCAQEFSTDLFGPKALELHSAQD